MIDKARLLRDLRERVASDLDGLVRRQQDAQKGATHEENRAEHGKDTRATEQSYLARGLAARVEEMRQSMSILEQAMQQMEPGPIMTNVRRIARPPKGEVYVRTESPRGDFGVFLVSDGSDKPYRVKVRAPSFATLQALQHMLRNAYVADAVVILGSIDIVLGEVDR